MRGGLFMVVMSSVLQRFMVVRIKMVERVAKVENNNGRRVGEEGFFLLSVFVGFLRVSVCLCEKMRV